MIEVSGQRTWNFILTGDVRSGAGVVLTSINNRGGAVCHADLFHPSADIRRNAHEAYYGECVDPVRMPEWYVEGETNPWQYINRTVLDNPLRGETSVGFHIAYQAVRKLELYDLLEERGRVGDFGVIQVIRNPVACFVSFKQAQQSGTWTRGWNTPVQTKCPSPVRVNAEELVAFCVDHETTQCKIRASCDDRMEIHYSDLVNDYQGVMARVFDFIELPPVPMLAKPACKRLKNRPIRERVSNWAEVKLEVPVHIRRMIEHDDLF